MGYSASQFQNIVRFAFDALENVNNLTGTRIADMMLEDFREDSGDILLTVSYSLPDEPCVWPLSSRHYKELKIRNERIVSIRSV